MTNQKASERAIVRTLLMDILLPAIGFGLGVGFATGNYPVSMTTGLAISGSIFVLYKLDQTFLHPRLEKLYPDWLQLGLEMTFSLLEHILGALLALFVCSRIFGFALVPSAAWVALGGMVIAFPIIHGTGLALRFYRQLKEKERQEEQLRALATQAELKALKAQINPHFLFNTLNTIAALIHADPAQAEATVERLAEMFRYLLAGSERGLVSLEEELTFVDGYLEIERARFGERLRVVREIALEALDVPMPSLILQPLVENAVRHGREADGSIHLIIRIQSQGNEVVVAIADQGTGLSKGARKYGNEGVWEYGNEGVSPLCPGSSALPPSRGHGLRNVDERLRKTYGEGYGLEIRDNEPRGAVVIVRIPVRSV